MGLEVLGIDDVLPITKNHKKHGEKPVPRRMDPRRHNAASSSSPAAASPGVSNPNPSVARAIEGFGFRARGLGQRAEGFRETKRSSVLSLRVLQYHYAWPPRCWVVWESM